MEIILDNVSYSPAKMKDLNMHIKSGRVYGLIGDDLNFIEYFKDILLRKVNQTSGEIYYDNDLVRYYDEINNKLENKIGFMPKIPVFLGQTVYENLEIVIDSYRYRVNEMSKRIHEVAKLVSLNEEILLRDPYKLSVGEQKKVSLAMVLLHNPTLIYLEEPTLGYDNKTKDNFVKFIKRLKSRKNRTIIISTNDLELMNMLVDDIIVFNNSDLFMNDSKVKVFEETRLLKKIGIDVPNTIKFSDMVLKKKNIKIRYRDDVNDLIKDIYRYSEWGSVKHE